MHGYVRPLFAVARGSAKVNLQTSFTPATLWGVIISRRPRLRQRGGNVQDRETVIDPHRHIRQRDIGLRVRRETLKATAQVVTE